MSDWELLREYVTSRSQAAFAQLVQRHVRWLHSVCARQLRDPHLAEDVTQAVFLLLSQKAAGLTADTSLTGWLFRTAQLMSSNVMKSERRRVNREKRAAAASEEYARQQQGDRGMRHESELLRTLDVALAHLRHQDRDVLLLRFYRDQSVAEAAIELQISLEAARKRFTRALEALRTALTDQGVTVPAAGASVMIAGAFASTASQAMPIRLSTWVANGASPSGASATAAAMARAVGASRGGLLLAAAATIVLLLAASFVLYKTQPKPAAVAGPRAVVASPPAPATAPSPSPSTAPSIARLDGHRGVVWMSALSPEGDFAVTRSTSELIRWDLRTNTPIGAPLPMRDQPYAVAIGPKGIVAAIDRNDVAVFDPITADTPRRISVATGSRGKHWSIAISPDATLLALGGIDGSARLHDIAADKEIRTFGTHADLIATLAFAPDGKTLITGGRDGELRVFDVTTGALVHHLTGHKAMIWQLGFSRDGKNAFSVARTMTDRGKRTDADPFIRIWDLTTGKERLAIPVQASTISTATFSPDGQRLAAIKDNQLIVWDLRDARELSRRAVMASTPMSAMVPAFSSDVRQLLLSGDRTNVFSVFHIALGDELSR